MTLLLGSDGAFAIRQGYSLLGIPKDQFKIGYITTAAKGTKDLGYLERHKQDFANLGYFYEEVDIENKTADELIRFFADKNIIHMEGGNTYYLLHAVKKGFDKLLTKLLAQGKVYVGTSAGATILGPTIDLTSWIPQDTDPHDTIGLNLVPFVIKCHYTDDKKAALQQEVNKLNHPFKILRDGQGILVKDGSYQFVGQGEEVEL